MAILAKFLEIIDDVNKAKKSKNKLWYIWKARHRKLEIIKELESKESFTIDDIRNCIFIIDHYEKFDMSSSIYKDLNISKLKLEDNKALYEKFIYVNTDKESGRNQETTVQFYIYTRYDTIDIDAYYFTQNKSHSISTHNTVERLNIESYISMSLIEDVKATINKIIERAFKS